MTRWWIHEARMLGLAFVVLAAGCASGQAAARITNTVTVPPPVTVTKTAAVVTRTLTPTSTPAARMTPASRSTPPPRATAAVPTTVALTTAAPTTSVATLASPDQMLCLNLMLQYRTLVDGPLNAALDASSDFPALFVAVAQFAGNVKKQAPGLADPLLRGDWVWLGIQAEETAEVLLDRDSSTSTASIEKLELWAKTAMKDCADS